MENKNWESDFRAFLEAEPRPAPAPLSANVRGQVLRLLQPPFWLVFLKLALVQAVAGGVTLLYCPQFGFSLTGSHGLMHYLMQYGEVVCMAGCGALFTSASLLAASLVLRTEEVRALRAHRLLQLSSLAGLSLGVFFCAGASVAAGMGLVWALAAVVGGLATLELGWSLRRRAHGAL